MKSAEQFLKNARFVLKKYVFSTNILGPTVLMVTTNIIKNCIIKAFNHLTHSSSEVDKKNPWPGMSGRAGNMLPPMTMPLFAANVSSNLRWIVCFISTPSYYVYFKFKKIRGNLVAIIIRYQFQHLDSCSECQYASLGQR